MPDIAFAQACPVVMGCPPNSAAGSVLAASEGTLVKKPIAVFSKASGFRHDSIPTGIAMFLTLARAKMPIGAFAMLTLNASWRFHSVQPAQSDLIYWVASTRVYNASSRRELLAILVPMSTAAVAPVWPDLRLVVLWVAFLRSVVSRHFAAAGNALADAAAAEFVVAGSVDLVAAAGRAARLAPDVLADAPDVLVVEQALRFVEHVVA